MTTALYRRYRPEAFGEMIGQSQVTDPLMTALRGDRVGHAYLFSGPRGCGKTTSARILARCLNCAAGPTDTPCGTCDSCVELGRGGGGSLDVVEIDAASHNGVDDARDLRERAIFAPARDRFKIFILDEAHMVTQQGFNALLKLVEEPPDHVKFIFATTEPEKVLGTIRSRTHHYPFRLVPPAAMLEYVQELCETEGVSVQAGVLPLVVRAGGGSPRDTLSLLDQLMAGSDVGADGAVEVAYERAVALLGYTHAELLDEVVDAFGVRDAAAAFAAVDRVIQTGQDPRRFVDDLLERLRDLIVVAATGQGAGSVLRGISTEELERMTRQSGLFGTQRLSRTADLVVTALDEMTGATSPRLHLELLVARVLADAGAAPASAPSPVAAPAVAAPAAPASAPQAPRAHAPAPAPADVGRPAATAPEPVAPPESFSEAEPPADQEPPTDSDAPPEPEGEFAPPAAAGPLTVQRLRDAWPEVLARLESISRTSWLIASGARVAALDDDVLTLAFASANDIAAFKKRTAGAGPSEDLRQAIMGVLGIRVKYIAKHEGDAGGPGDAGPPASPPPAPDRQVRESPAAPPAPRSSPASAPSAAAPVTDWAVAPIPTTPEADPRTSSPSASSGPRTSAAPGVRAVGQFPVDDEPEEASSVRVATLEPVRDGSVLPDRDVEASAVIDDDPEDEFPPPDDAVDAPVPPVVAPRMAPVVTSRGGVQRVGEAVVRQVLGATFVREEPFESPTRFV
ncbi:DNA polymerase-3 subunit gamma/tau [Microbacterium sp. AG1240]|uniref:DNA polymerase III subunit gamma and tau n=1 Tax=Microbacterium sp. AG1240 TaxID=2183992 RepID=UPI000EAD9472|nr:DNA polymerase III subunit gamma and tau [Microbacterium sp. AG1240]RKT33390.1 DNA polymerase-3 subunit gamma/tau [Microbacterium sp. AG1240]